MSYNNYINLFIFNDNIIQSKQYLAQPNNKFNNLKAMATINFINNNTISVSNLFTNKHHRNKGYASKLMNFIIANYKQKYTITLQTSKNNKNAIKLYSKLNFSISNSNNNILTLTYIP